MTASGARGASDGAIPRDGSVDASLAFLREGYAFVSNRCRRLGTDAFETRLLGRRAVCVLGAEAAEVFYTRPMTRRRALPAPVLTLLQDRGSVQLLDGAAHHRRKGLFLSLLTGEGLERLSAVAADGWREAVRRWERSDEVELLAGAEDALCRVVCDWAGVPLGEGEAARRAADFAAMIDGAGSFGPRNWRGHLARRRTERWVEGVVEAVRDGRLAISEDAPAFAIAAHRDGSGRPLPAPVATVEILNLLRPAVAVARFVVFAALALHEHRTACDRMRWEDDGDIEAFVQEVRRFYPFFPAIPGRVAGEFEWRGRRFPPGAWLLLDVYGTNRDPRAWDDPDAFRPERFRGWPGSLYAFVPQGGGDHATGHRCPGEWATVALAATAVRALTRELTYDVPAQDLRVRLSRMPARPESGFVIRNVRVSSEAP